jgi:hypothetical protein
MSAHVGTSLETIDKVMRGFGQEHRIDRLTFDSVARGRVSQQPSRLSGERARGAAAPPDRSMTRAAARAGKSRPGERHLRPEVPFDSCTAEKGRAIRPQ